MPEVLGLHPAQRLAEERGEQELAQRRDHALPGRHVVPRGDDAGQEAVERRGEQARAGAPQLGLEGVEQLAIPPRRQRGVGAVHRARDLPLQILAVLRQQVVDGRLGHGDRTCAARADHAGEAAARLPDDQLGRRAGAQLHLPPLELGQDQVERRLPLLVEGLPDGGQRRRREPRLLDVVEADHRHVGGDLQAPLLEGAHRAQRHVVVAGDEAVELHPALVDQQLDGRLAGALLEVPLADDRRIEGESPFGEDRAVDGVTALGLGVDGGAADEGDAPAAVAHQQMLQRLPHPRLLVEGQAGDVRWTEGQAGHRQRRQPRAEGVDRRRSERVAERASEDHGAVDALGVAEIEDEVAVHPLGARRADDAAREDGQAHLAPAGGVGQAGQQRRLVGAAHRIEEHADHRPPVLPLAAARACPFAGRGRAHRSGLIAPAHHRRRGARPRIPPFVPRAAAS